MVRISRPRRSWRPAPDGVAPSVSPGPVIPSGAELFYVGCGADGSHLAHTVVDLERGHPWVVVLAPADVDADR